MPSTFIHFHLFAHSLCILSSSLAQSLYILYIFFKLIHTHEFPKAPLRPLELHAAFLSHFLSPHTLSCFLPHLFLQPLCTFHHFPANSARFLLTSALFFHSFQGNLPCLYCQLYGIVKILSTLILAKLYTYFLFSLSCFFLRFLGKIAPLHFLATHILSHFCL